MQETWTQSLLTQTLGHCTSVNHRSDVHRQFTTVHKSSFQLTSLFLACERKQAYPAVYKETIQKFKLRPFSLSDINVNDRTTQEQDCRHVVPHVTKDSFTKEGISLSQCTCPFHHSHSTAVVCADFVSWNCCFSRPCTAASEWLMPWFSYCWLAKKMCNL